MNITHKFLLTPLFCIFLILSTSCANIQLSSKQMDPDYEGRYLKSVMVVGVTDEFIKRKVFENALVRQFLNQGVKALSSAVLISHEKGIKKEIIKAKAEEVGLETIFLTRLKGINEDSDRVFVSTTGARLRKRGIDIPVHQYGSPEIAVKHTRVRLEIQLYEVKTEKMIWSAASDIFNPESAEEAVTLLGEVIMKDLRDSKLLK